MSRSREQTTHSRQLTQIRQRPRGLKRGLMSWEIFTVSGGKEDTIQMLAVCLFFKIRIYIFKSLRKKFIQTETVAHNAILKFQVLDLAPLWFPVLAEFSSTKKGSFCNVQTPLHWGTTQNKMHPNFKGPIQWVLANVTACYSSLQSRERTFPPSQQASSGPFLVNPHPHLLPQATTDELFVPID